MQYIHLVIIIMVYPCNTSVSLYYTYAHAATYNNCHMLIATMLPDYLYKLLDIVWDADDDNLS